MMAIWESGYWKVSESQAKAYLRKRLYLHKKQAAPSYFGGEVVGYRWEKWQGQPRVGFQFELTNDMKGQYAPSRSWGAMVEKLLGENSIHLLQKNPKGLGLLAKVSD